VFGLVHGFGFADVLRAFGVEKSKRTSEFRAPPFTSGSS
jgi:hypothetical protein